MYSSAILFLFTCNLCAWVSSHGLMMSLSMAPKTWIFRWN